MANRDCICRVYLKRKLVNIIMIILLFYSSGKDSEDLFGYNENNDFWLDNVNCDGNEKSIAECGHSGWGIENCFYFEAAGVICEKGFFFVELIIYDL